MKLKRTTLETLAKLTEKMVSKDNLRHTITHVHVFGLNDGRRELVAYATDGCKAVRFERLPDAQEGPLAEFLQERPLLVSKEHGKLIKSLLKAAHKYQEEFDARLDNGKLLVRSSNVSDAIEVTCGFVAKQTGEYLDQLSFEIIFKTPSNIANDNLGNTGLVIETNVCPTLGFNAELLADMQDALCFGEKSQGVTLTLAQEQTLSKDGKGYTTSRMVVKPISKELSSRTGVLCGMRVGV
jgi:hypothetical protein